jgi:hypothetical protein
MERLWRPLLLPALMLWILAAYLSSGLHLSSGDVSEYQRYAHAALRSPMFHHLPLEYPAPALAIFIVPLVLPLAYPLAFAVMVGAVMVALLVSYVRTGLPGVDLTAARRLLVYLTLGGSMFLAARYDLFVAAAAFWAYRAARQGKWAAAWSWSSIGFLLKLFPAVLWPAFLIAEWRTERRFPVRRLLWMAGSAALIAGLPALFNPSAVFNEVHYYVNRPVEIGSLASGISLLIDWHAWHYVLSFHSINTVNPIAAPLSTALTIAAGLACIATWWAQARGRLPLDVACLATLTLVVLGAKVLSVQYLLWLMPFWSVYRFRATWIMACLANTIIFPYTVSAMTLGHVPADSYALSLALTYLTRDVLIAVGTATWLWPIVLRRSASGRSDAPAASVGAPSAGIGSARSSHGPEPEERRGSWVCSAPTSLDGARLRWRHLG